MIITTLLLLAVSVKMPTIGPWLVTCENDSPATDGLFDRCRMVKISDGTEVSVVRTASGATFTAKISGCKIKTAVEPFTVSNEDLVGPNAKEAFLGGQLRAIIGNNRQCPQRGMTLSVGGPEVPELLAATAKLRSASN